MFTYLVNFKLKFDIAIYRYFVDKSSFDIF